jgi:hypothetical protein
MNRGLLLLAVVIIGAGLFYGVTVLALVGLFLLFPAVLAPSRRPYPQQRSRPVQTRQAPPSTPTPEKEAEPPVQQTKQAPEVRYDSSSSMSGQALFPGTMFPSLSLPQISPTQPTGESQRAKEDGAELVEAAAILVLLRLLAG